MSTGTLDRPKQAAPGRPRVLLAIARFEAKKVWHHPALIIGALITANELYRQIDWTSAPVLNRDSYISAWPMIIYAAGLYLAIGMIVNRRHGAHKDEGMDALPATPLTRIAGTGLAFVSPLLVALVMQGTVLVARAVNGAVTSIVWAEALTGPATVVLGATAGMAVGWAFKSPSAVPIAGLGFLGGTLLVWWEDFIFGFYTPWLAPVPALDRNYYIFEQIYRPSTTHLVYVVLLTLLFVAIAMIRGRHGNGRVISIASALLLLAAVVFVGSAQLKGLTAAEEAEWEARYLPTSGEYVCEERGSVTYCAYPGYEPWIDEWAADVEAAIDLMPREVANRPLEIRQQVPYFADEDELPPVGDLVAGMWWSREAYDSSLVSQRLGMALAVAGWATGFPATPARTPVAACSSHDQGRAVAALWYAIQSSAVAREALEFQASGERFGGLSPMDNAPIDIGFRQPSSSVNHFRREATVALELSELPVTEVAGTFEDRWDELTDPGVTTEDVASWFAVETPEMGPPWELGSVPCP